MITGFRNSIGTAGVSFLALALLAYLLLPLGHPVYAVFVPPLIVAGLVYAALRLRAPKHPSIRNHGDGGVTAAPKDTPSKPR
jgi:hypothetical protein